MRYIHVTVKVRDDGVSRAKRFSTSPLWLGTAYPRKYTHHHLTTLLRCVTRKM